MNVITKNKSNDNDEKDDDKCYINIKNEEPRISSPTTSLRKRFQDDGKSITNKSNRLFHEEVSSEEQQSQPHHYSSYNQRTSALTLPMHISHLPLTNINQRKSLQLSQSQVGGKLSARYINNTGAKININKSRKSLSMDEKQYQQQTISYKKDDEIAVNRKNNEKLNTNNNNINDKSYHFENEVIDEETLSATSTLICYCEKKQSSNFGNDCHNSDPFNVMNKDEIRTKRLVSTRNAATSPHLDARKMNNLTTLTATMYLRNTQQQQLNTDGDYKDEYVKSEGNYSNDNDKQKEQKVNGGDNNQYSLEKSQSIKEGKTVKYLRTTRSLSPRPPPIKHHSKTIEREIGLDYELNVANEPPTTSPRINRAIMELRQRKGQNVCKSEQSSPNIFDDDDKIKFAYNQATTNRSTGCLVYIPSDPWLKMSDNQRDDVENVNPWVKRPNERVLKRQSKSLQASTQAQMSTEIMSAESMKTSLSPIRMVNNKQSSSNVLGDAQKSFQLSAPSSPHFLNTPENPFSSVYSLNNAYVGVDHHYYQQQHQHPYHYRHSNYQYNPPQHGHHPQHNSHNQTQHPYRNHYYYARTDHLIGDVKDRCTPPPIRSSSFSPGHSRDANNPFLDATISIQQLLPSSPPPIIAILSESGEKNDNNDYDNNDPSTFSQRRCFNSLSTTDTSAASATFTIGRNKDSFLLDVCNPNLLQTRHSFSSVTNTMVSGLSDEMPLNIRRLSDQMRRKGTFSPNFIGKELTNNNFNNDYKLNFNSLSKIEKKIKSSITTLITTPTTVAITTTPPVAVISDIKKGNIVKSEDSKPFESNVLSKRSKKAKTKLNIQEKLPWPKRAPVTLVSSPPPSPTMTSKEVVKQRNSRQISGKSSTDSLLETTC